MPEPSVTVVIPAYNAAAFIADTLHSVINQTFSDWEVWVIDDASTDDTPFIVGDFAARDTRIQLYSVPENYGGPAGPRNLGVSRASGEWIAFLDADDIWHPQKLERQLAAMNASGGDYCCTTMKDFSGPTPTAFDDPGQVSTSHVTFAMQRRKSRVPLSSVLVRKSVIRDFPFNQDPKYRAVEDYHCWLRVLEQCGPMLKLKFPFVSYRVSEGQISGSKVEMLKKNYMVHREYPGTNILQVVWFLLTYAFLGIGLRVFGDGL